jgi:hypothetical protein
VEVVEASQRLNPGWLTPARAADLARRGAAARRARRDYAVAERLEQQAASLLVRATGLRERTRADLAAHGMTPDDALNRSG